MTYKEFLSIIAHRISPAVGAIRFDDNKGKTFDHEHLDRAYRKLFVDFGFANDADPSWEDKAITEAKALNELLNGQRND